MGEELEIFTSPRVLFREKDIYVNTTTRFALLGRRACTVEEQGIFYKSQGIYTERQLCRTTRTSLRSSRSRSLYRGEARKFFKSQGIYIWPAPIWGGGARNFSKS